MSLVKTYPLLAWVLGLPVVDLPFGSSISASSRRSRRAGSSSKTSLPFVLADWIPCSGASLRSGMMRSGIVYPLPPLALLTGATGCGLWPTPCAQNHRIGMSNRYGPGQRRSMLNDAVAHQMMWPTPHGICAPGPRRPGPSGNELGRAVLKAERAMWPTPTATADHQGLCTPAKGREGGTLVEAVSARMWPPPASRDYRHPNAKAYSERGGGKKGEQLPNAVGGALNPTWVEWLMGFPLGWTDCGPSETRLSRKSLK